MRAKCSTHLILLDFIFLITYAEDPHYVVFSSPTNILNQWFSLRWETEYHAYRSNIIVVYILIFIYLKIQEMGKQKIWNCMIAVILQI
jgi:hypothetical protein